MEIAKIIYLLEEALNKKVADVENLGRQHSVEKSILANDLKMLSSLIMKHSDPELYAVVPRLDKIEKKDSE